ncbi:hypothetical protein K2173_015262 [Erythroxylum novogranatense]|uniref:B-like cyclin n=1 Tax=Erythroxylum novogranatense TaxID=1862640 RepID=A0AAV8T2W4_9ROSI|nr:hypothetical protein K2173_015262 [Erythroxylum novogranatense]
MKLKCTSALSLLQSSQPFIRNNNKQKQQRSQLPRRVRRHISPILYSSAPPTGSEALCGFSVNSNFSSSYLWDQASSDSSRVTEESRVLRKRKSQGIEIEATRSYHKQTVKSQVEVCESSCDSAAAGPQNVRETAVVSVSSPVESCLSLKTVTGEPEQEHDAVSVHKKFRSMETQADLACTEDFSYDDSETAYSELHSDLFSSDIYLSDYSPSVFLDSGSQFSDKSTADSPPTCTYSLLKEFRKQFLRSSVSLDSRRYSDVEAQRSEKFNFVRFGDEEEELNYERMRERERRQLLFHDYVELHCSTKEDCRDFMLHQRLLMVHWIVQQSTIKEFHNETMFLGVGLLDRFLSKGIFKNERNLQILCIACLTLATRLEENQPYNSVKETNFRIGSNLYTRCEVVAMEWLVQEVLNFQCFFPTIYNFIWFYLKASRADTEVEKTAVYLAVLALSDREQLRYWPSTVAAGVVILALLENDQISSYERVIEVHVRTGEEDLHQCMKNLERLLQYVN